MLYQIVKETGWSWHYILWKVSRANLLLMLADQSNFKTIKKTEEAKADTGENLYNRFKARGKI